MGGYGSLEYTILYSIGVLSVTYSTYCMTYTQVARSGAYECSDCEHEVCHAMIEVSTLARSRE